MYVLFPEKAFFHHQIGMTDTFFHYIGVFVVASLLIFHNADDVRHST